MIVFDAPLAHATHALAQLSHQPPDTAVLRARLAAADAALDAFEAALAHPLAEIDEHAHRAYLAAIVLACTLAAMSAELTNIRRTTARLLELFDRFASEADRKLRNRLRAPPVRAWESERGPRDASGTLHRFRIGDWS